MNFTADLLALGTPQIIIICICAAFVLCGAVLMLVKFLRGKKHKNAAPSEDGQPNDIKQLEADIPAPPAVPAVTEGKPIYTAAPKGTVFVRIRYNRSYTAKLIQASDQLKDYYSSIKNELLRYGVKPRISWRHETFRKGRTLIAKLTIRGKTLNMYLALDPSVYAESKYKVDDVSSVGSNAGVPLRYKIKNGRRCLYSRDLIARVMAEQGLQAAEIQGVDYASMYPYEELAPLINRNLIKLVSQPEEVSAEEAAAPVSAQDGEIAEAIIPLSDISPEYVRGEVSAEQAEEIIGDEQAESLVEDSLLISDRTRKEIINIDALGKYFAAGETVTVEEIKKRVPAFNKRATYVKVLARGRLDKQLVVVADDFSPAAVKMIVLTGGKAVRKRSFR